MKAKGKCPVCKRWIRITNKDRLFCHGAGRRLHHCPGWGQEPLEIVTEANETIEQILERARQGPRVKRERPQRKE